VRYFSLRVWLSAVAVLLVSGAIYRVAASRLELVIGSPITLPVPLSEIPTTIGSWKGVDVPISESVQRVAGNDDFINRQYIDDSTGNWASIYVAYSANPRTMVGHRPRKCYVGAGWIHDSTDKIQMTSGFGRLIPCLRHRFHKPAGDIEDIVVVNFYVINGKLASDEEGFSGISWRKPNLNGDPARYVAQIQISSKLENSVQAAANGIVERILDFLPDENGYVRSFGIADD
jgi:hypothetical protein